MDGRPVALLHRPMIGGRPYRECGCHDGYLADRIAQRSGDAPTLGAPFIECLRNNKPLGGALAGITAAVVGVILNLAIWFALHTWFRHAEHVHGFGFSFDVPILNTVDPWAVLLSIAAIIAIFRFEVGMITTLAACSAASLLLYLAGAI